MRLIDEVEATGVSEEAGVRVVEPLAPGEREPAPPAPGGSIAIDAVPAAQRPKPMPIIRVLMPVIMVAAMLAMVAVMFLGNRAASPMMLVLPLMMGMSMLMMFSPPQSEGDVDETRRTYLRHLGVVREKALANAHAQRANSLHHHPAPADLRSRLGSRRMWERAADDADALEVRLGLGDALLGTSLDVKDSGATEELEPVCAVSLRRTLHGVSTIKDMPVVVQLRAFRFIALAGPGARDLARAVVAQLVTAHGPEVIGVQAIGEQWDWIKWLPHAQRPDQARYPILLVDDVATTGTEDFIDDDSFACVIDVATRPAASALALRAETEGLALGVDDALTVFTATGVETLGVPDRMNAREALIFARALTPFVRPTAQSGRSGGDLLSLLGVGSVDDLAPEDLWPERAHPRDKLAVPVGVSEYGESVRLDLKESAHGGTGPHGLCIGATGSGKSELLKSLVTSLAATHSPEELNLVLVDFKGGATFLGCERLPHTAAVITNLEDEAVLVERMYDAVSGELNRRQEVLRKAGNFANITDYNAARGESGSPGALESSGSSLPPLPSLVIIVDEFSELLGQHLDFAELFVAVGRLGRSLGVHLLLASQRLEEGKLRGLDSHLSYRIGLKTFSAGESRQVLGVPDAYHLPAQPGAGILKSNSDQLTRFQAAYVSGPLPRRVSRAHGMDAAGTAGMAGTAGVADPVPRVRPFIGMTSAPSMPVPVWEQEADEPVLIEHDDSRSLFTAVVDVAREAAAVRGLTAHRMWLEPLPARIELSAVVQQGQTHAFQPIIGVIDRPYHQRQDRLRLDLTSGGGHVAICGAPQSGKTGTLRTLAASIAHGAGPDECRMYLIDLGGGGLEPVARLPHVAGYAGRGEEERIRRIVDEVSGLVDAPEPRHTFLIIDGWHALTASGSELDDLVDPLTSLAADGPAARVHLIIATPRWTTLRPAIRDLIAHRVELRLVEALDSLVDRKAQEKLPALPGRGLAPDGAQMLVAFTASQDVEHLRAAAERAGHQPVPRLKELPAQVRRTELAAPTRPGIAFGVGGPQLDTQTWDPAVDPHLVVVGSTKSGKSSTLATIMAGIGELGRDAVRLVVLDQRRTHLGRIDDDLLAAYAGSTTAVADALRNTVATLKARMPAADVSPQELRERSWWSGPEIYLVIDDLDLVPDVELHPVIELLPYARDIGLHLVVARKSGGVGRALFSGVLAALSSEQPAALILSADKDDGVIFGVRPSPQPPGRATFVTQGTARGACQIALPDDPDLVHSDLDTDTASEEFS